MYSEPLTIQFKWVNFVVCELYLTKALKKNKCVLFFELVKVCTTFENSWKISPWPRVPRPLSIGKREERVLSLLLLSIFFFLMSAGELYFKESLFACVKLRQAVTFRFNFNFVFISCDRINC